MSPSVISRLRPAALRCLQVSRHIPETAEIGLGLRLFLLLNDHVDDVRRAHVEDLMPLALPASLDRLAAILEQ